MSGGGNFPGLSGTGAPEMPPLVRTPPSPGDNHVTDPLPFRPRTEDAPLIESKAEATLGPTGRPIPFLPDPAPVSEPGKARITPLCTQKAGWRKTPTTPHLEPHLTD